MARPLSEIRSAGQEAVREVLQTHTLFSVLPGPDRRLLEPLFEVHEYKAQQEIAAQGATVDAVYILYSGRLRLKRTRDGKRISLGELGPMATLGESSLLGAATWPYLIQSCEPSVMLRLPAEKLRTLLVQQPRLIEFFKQNIGLVALGHRLRALLGRAECSSEQFAGMLKFIGVKNIAKGALIYQQGAPDNRLYCVEAGVIELRRQPLRGEPIHLARRHPGDLFGEAGALGEREPIGIQPHSALAVDDATVLVIRQEAVQQIVAINPGLVAHLREQHERLKGVEDEELEVRQRAEGVNQRIKLAEAVTEQEYLRLHTKEEIGRFPWVRQNADSDCAAACLAMVCHHYGKHMALGQVRELCNLSNTRPTPDHIITGAERLGLLARAYALRYEDLKRLVFPAIIGWEDYHYVVLYRMTETEVFLADPAEGYKKLEKKAFLLGWTQADVPGVTTLSDRGVLIALDPSVDFNEHDDPAKPIYRFLHYILPYKKHFAEALVAALTINVLGLATPLFVQTIVDSVVVHHDVSLLNLMLVGMGLVALFSALSMVFQSLLLAHTTARIDVRIMAEFFRHVLSLPLSFFMTRNKGEILARFGENTKIRQAISSSSIIVVLNALMITLYLLMMLGYSTDLTFVFVLFVPLYVGVVWYFTPRIKRISQEIFQTGANAQARLIESLNAIETFKATANEYMARANWENSFVDNVNKGYQSARLNLISNSLNKLISLTSSVVILWLGANEVIAGGMTIGELMGFNILAGMVIGPILQLVGLWNNIIELRNAIDRVGEVLSVEPEQPPVRSPETMPAVLGDCQGRIEFSKVDFSYVTNDKENFVIRDLDLTVEPGSRVALVGPSGCGKSTIAKMILGFHLPKSGECRIDGKDIRTLDFGSVRRNIGIVLQDSFVISGTVAENIALGDPEPDMAAVAEAAKIASAHEFIINYPLGYQTLIGEKGVGISGGQRQRICIARAVYRKPKIVILDEATSAMDAETERRVKENLARVLRGCTCVMITHRLSTIADADLIHCISEGSVREQGTHTQLIDPQYLKERGYRGLYYRLAQIQFGLPPLALN